jgi:localization factor PodJL
MARAYSLSETPENDPDAQSGEWQALRGELVALLDQVEGRYATRQAPADPQVEGLARRVRALRNQVVETPGLERRREALRSVKRAVDRFSERDDNGTGEPDELRAAIAEIRSRQTSAQVPIVGRSAPDNGQLTELTALVGGLSGRLERLEAELRGLHHDAGGVREIAGQVEQLSQVVELLAGAVGETGQVKRLETQLAGLAKLVADRPQVDADAINTRLDEVAATVGKLAELQVQQMEREIVRDERPAAPDPALRAIEEGIRNVYDRIDAIEKNVGASPLDLDRMTEEMAAFTAAMQRQDAVPQSLVAKIDAMTAQIGGFEGQGGDVAELRRDIAALRDAVIGGLEPRFARIETQIEALSGAAPMAPDGPSVGQIENQLRKLMERLDETGAKIDDLAGLQPGAAPASLDAFEKRMSALINTAGRETAERLTRLETTLSRRAETSASLEAAKVAKPQAARDLMPANPADEKPLVDPGFAEGPVRAALEAKNGPRLPSGKPAAGSGAPAAKQASAAQSDRSAFEPKSFDPTSVERPPRPVSSLTEPAADPFGETARKAPAPEPAAAAAPLSAQSTFIAAARRAQRAKQEAAGQPAAASSLIGRAFSRVATPADDGRTAGEPVVGEDEPKRDKRRWGLGSRKDATTAQTEPVPAVDLPEEPLEEEAKGGFWRRNRRALLLAVALVAVSALALNLAMQRLGASRVTPAPQIEETAPAETGEAPDLSTMLDAEPVESAATLTAPQVGDVIDTSATASINSAATRFAVPLETPTMPATLAAGEAISYAAAEADVGTTASEPQGEILVGSIPSTSDGPVTFAPPAEDVGPQAMREAAANGDARAQFEVAAILTEGRVVEQDYAEAAVWYERSAAQGFAPAQYRLGNLYESGNGVEKDLEVARLWYQRAAEAGNRMAMHNLAAIHAGGEMGEQDFETAAEWFEQAGERGMTDSQFNLGMLFARGLGVDQNFENSYKWFSLAARSGDTDAAKARDDIARSLSAEAVARLNEEAAAWKGTPIDLAANFAPIGTWDEEFNPGEVISNREVVTKVQQALARLGYDIGAADGLVGPKTREAVKAFEHGTGMSESGAINPRLLAVLGSQPV